MINRYPWKIERETNWENISINMVLLFVFFNLRIRIEHLWLNVFFWNNFLIPSWVCRKEIESAINCDRLCWVSKKKEKFSSTKGWKLYHPKKHQFEDLFHFSRISIFCREVEIRSLGNPSFLFLHGANKNGVTLYVMWKVYSCFQQLTHYNITPHCHPLGKLIAGICSKWDSKLNQKMLLVTNTNQQTIHIFFCSHYCQKTKRDSIRLKDFRSTLS